MQPSYLIACSICTRPVEGVIVAEGVQHFRGYWPMADHHERAFGHYPERAMIRQADTIALRVVGRKV